jgi:hypothetical protein
MTRITLTKAQALRMGILDPSPAESPVESTATRKPAKAGTRVDSHPMLSGAVLGGLVGLHRHRFRRCEAWGCFISICGIGRHHEPVEGEGDPCVRCYEKEAV